MAILRGSRPLAVFSASRTTEERGGEASVLDQGGPQRRGSSEDFNDGKARVPINLEGAKVYWQHSRRKCGGLINKRRT